MIQKPDDASAVAWIVSYRKPSATCKLATSATQRNLLIVAKIRGTIAYTKRYDRPMKLAPDPRPSIAPFETYSEPREMVSTSPLLRWAGSKRQVVSTLLKLAPIGFSRYVEPFAGSATLFFAMQPRVALLSDSNEELIDFMKEIQQDWFRIHSLVSALPRTADSYVQMRAMDPGKLDRTGRAVRFFFLNRMCFNGVYRVNAAGAFNVPMGKKLPPFPSEGAIEAASNLLQRAELVQSDFETVLQDCGRGDFVYVDPPYSTSTRHRGEYGAKRFSDADLSRLCDCLVDAVDRGAGVALSYPYKKNIRDRLSTWRCKRVTVRRTVAANSSARGSGGEAIYLSYL